MHQDFYEGLENASGFYEGEKNASGLYEGLKNQQKNPSPFCERLNNLHHDFMKVLKFAPPFCEPLPSLQQVANGGLLHEPIGRWSAPKRTTPETVVGLRKG